MGKRNYVIPKIILVLIVSIFVSISAKICGPVFKQLKNIGEGKTLDHR